MTNSYNTQDNENLPIILNWPGRATEDNREFVAMKKHEQDKNTFDGAKSNRRESVEIHMNQEEAMHIARDACNVRRQTIFRKYAEDRADRSPEMKSSS